RARRAARRSSSSGARSCLTAAEVGGGWWRCGRMVEAAPEQPPPTSTNLHQPPPSSHRPPLHDAALERIPRSFRPLVATLERRDVERDRGQVVDQNRPGRQRPDRRHGLEVALARVADLDLARLLARLGGQITEAIVIGLIAVHAAQLGDRPSGDAAARAQLEYDREARVVDHTQARTAPRE